MTVPLTVALSPEQEEYVRTLARELGGSMSGVIRGLIDAAIRDMPPPPRAPRCEKCGATVIEGVCIDWPYHQA